MSEHLLEAVREGELSPEQAKAMIGALAAARFQQRLEAERKTGAGAALVEGFSIANIAMSAQRGAAASDAHARQEEKDERYSHADSQDEIDTLLSSDWGAAY